MIIECTLYYRQWVLKLFDATHQLIKGPRLFCVDLSSIYKVNSLHSCTKKNFGHEFTV